MRKQAPVYTFAVRFTGKQAKAIEAAAKQKGVSPEAMVRQAVRDALDRAQNRPQDKQHLENYVLNLLGNRRPGAQPQRTAAPQPVSPAHKALEKRVLSTLEPTGKPKRAPAKKK
jgi:hypothetical protein